MRHEGEPPQREEPFWHLDEELGELELRERPSGPDVYTVRLKAHTRGPSTTPSVSSILCSATAPNTRSQAKPTSLCRI